MAPPEKPIWLRILDALIDHFSAPAGGTAAHAWLGSGLTVPQRPPVIQQLSPNFRRTPGRKPTCVVIHATATSGLASPLAWLCSPASKVSAHYLIEAAGIVYQLVHEEDVAWHAGVSEWRGRAGVNDFSIGIELVNPNDGYTPYPNAQLVSCAALVRAIRDEHGIALEDVVGHLHVAPGRKTDPAGFPWEHFKGMIA